MRALLVDTKVAEEAIKYLEVGKKLVSVTDLAGAADTASEISSKLLVLAPSTV